MRRVTERDIEPETIVRSMAHQMGYRSRVHQRSLPGNPDRILENVVRFLRD
jgi:DNA mismatch endonuclease (patch repair protein)